ncbi:hypothetical protein LAZ67_X004343 [Cordylochernes scorpioides]|uniref:Polyprotein n=1 Tax=Cordylochernes scorpioides TaxID=51811 RepID=A0ABY6LUW4_9ARAC|nr:hypothetical protein LAZ67_X004343 [Cordylochernes scorpioides]
MAKTKKENDAEFAYQAMPSFVKYNNSLNIKTWITNFERKSDSYGFDNGWKVLHLSDYLQDEVLTYYFESLCNIEDWSKLKESLIIRFHKVKLTPLVEMMKITQEEHETVTQYFHRKMQLINSVELNLTSIVELLNEGIKTKYKPYLATIDAVQPSEWLTMAIKVENSLTGSGTPVEKGRLQTLNPALHPSPRPAGYYGNSQVQRPPMPCRICERLGLELQWHYHSVCPYRSPTASRSPATPRVQRPTASRSFSSASPHSYQAAASSSFPPPTPHDYQPTVPSASSPDSPRSGKTYEFRNMGREKSDESFPDDGHICHAEEGIRQVLNVVSDIARVNGGIDDIGHAFAINLIVSELTGVGDKIEDGDLSMLILCGMPEDWDNVISTMCNLPESEFTSANIRRKLLAEAERRYATTNEGMGALSVRNSNKKQFPHEHQGSKTVRKCFGCGKTGHIARDCFKLKKNNGKQQEKGAIHQLHEAKNLNVMYNAAVVSEEDTWVIDSGATHHMTPNRRYFSTLNDENVGQVTTIDGTSHSNIGKGNAQVDLINNSGQLRSIVAQNAMFVPGIRHGVLSVLQIVENGHEVIFDKKGCHIYDNDHNLMIRAEKRGRLYLVRTAPSRFPESGECSNSIAQTNNFRKFPLNLWHQRLMHINYDTIVDMMKREVVIGLNCQAGKPDKCSDCMIGKSTKRPFLNLRSTKETQTLALVHCDLMGPFNIESWGGSRFVLTIIDDASRYTRVYFLKRKGDTLEKFKEWMKEAENKTGFSLKRIRTDNGLEFCSSPWDIFTKAHGIVHERNMVYTPEQNGVAERMNRTLLNLVRSTVNSCNLPTASWAELTNTAAYLRNRVTNRHNEEKTPFELWFGKRPALQHLRAIGCETFVHVPKQRRNSKLQPRATKGILVGYSLQGRGWRIWIPEKRQVVESRNCVFKEEILYKQPKRERDTLPSVHFSSKEASFQEESNADQPVDRETEELIGTTGGIDQLSETLPENLRSHPMTLRSHGKTAESPEEDNSGGQINATSAEDNNPTYEEAMNSPEVVNWIEAIEEERESLERHDVWQLQELPKGIKPLKCRWVLNKKINAVDGTTRYKARLVAKGFTQRRGIDYNEVYTPVSSFETIRLLTAIATEKDWFIDQFDVKSAYLHGTLNETIYMEQPECFKKPGEENLFCKLKKSIYGLKQSGRCWNKFLNKQLHEIGFQRNPIDPSIYEVELEEGRIILSIYVDDIFAISENQAARNKCRELLNSSFEVKYLGPISHMLGVSFKKSEDGSMTLSQSNYIEELLQRFRLQDAKGISTPMETNLDLSVRKNGNSNERFPYRERIGGLSYLSQRTRPDIAYAVGILSRYCDNYTRKHWEAGKRVLRYLKSTKDFGITYRSTGKPLIAFSNASWASDIVDRKGVSGHLIILAGAPIIWRSTKQTVTALSTMESEYIALSSAVKDITWVRNLMEQLKMSSLICGETKVFCDNQAAISHAENYIDKSKTRHFAVKYHFVREKISEEAIELFYTPSAENPADFLTKPLARSQHEKYCRALMDYRNKRPAEVIPGGDMLDTSAATQV